MNELPPTPSDPPIGPALGSGFRRVPRTGVIYVSAEARKHGFGPGAQGWCNLGQGQPDTSALAGAPPRIESIPVLEHDREYAPVAGLWELREAVAELYNALYRRGMGSKYSAENVAICGGGRVSIMRACAAIAPVHLGHFLPDYTAYEELLDVFRRFQPIPILLDPKRGYTFTPAELEAEILGRGLGALLMSNACNPTGKLVHGDELAEWVQLASATGCAMLMDEFYSHYIWPASTTTTEVPMVSAARYVEDVDRDPIVIFDGLTKNWRYPGFRVTWIVGPRAVIDSVSSAGSFLDGGGSAPMQRAAIALLDPESTLSETRALQEVFGEKRDFLLERLRALGVRFDLAPEGTFYLWGDVSQLPEGLNTGDDLFHAALQEKVICVPGHFFDINPGKRRVGRHSRFSNHVRFSFGPKLEELSDACARLERLISG